MKLRHLLRLDFFRQNLLKRCLLVGVKLTFAVIAFYVIFSKVALDKLVLSIERTNISLLILALIVQNLSTLGSAMRSRYYLRCYGIHISKLFAVCYYYVGTLFNVMLPGGIGGDGYKVYLLWKYKKLAKLLGLRIMLYERVNGFYPLAFLGLIFFISSSFIDIIPYGLQLTIGGILLITPCYLFGVKFILKDKIAIALGAARFSLYVQLLQIVSAVILVKAMVPGASFQEYIDYTLLFIVATIMAILPVSVGGAGLRELTFLYGMQLLAFQDTETGVAFAMMNFALYLLTAFIGVPIYLLSLVYAERPTEPTVEGF